MVQSSRKRGKKHHGPGSTTTTEAAVERYKYGRESLRTLARRYGINQKAVANWKRRGSVADLPTDPRPEVDRSHY